MSKVMKCKNCGADLYSSEKNCLKCGVLNSKSNRLKYIFGAIGILLVLIVFVTVRGANGNKSGKIDTSKEVASTAAENTDTKASENTDSAASSTSEKDSKQQDKKITYENFLNIKMGQSYEEVVELLGEGKEISSKETDGVKTTVYDWKEHGASDVNVTIENNVVTSKSQLGLESMDAKITLDKYNQVQNGISYEELKELLGEGQILLQSKTGDVESTIYEYINQNESNANFTFNEGKLVGKSQFNLE